MASILLLEDELGFQELLCRVLTATGYSVVACESGAQVRALAAEQTFDLFLFDNIVPDVLGLDLLDELREAGIQTPAIVMTGVGADVEKVRHAMHSRALDFLVKPFSPIKVLLPTIERSMLVWSQRRQRETGILPALPIAQTAGDSSNSNI
jgi:DNA-binding NtrC family response regulator